MFRFICYLTLLLSAGVISSGGHDSPTHRIEALSVRMESDGESSTLMNMRHWATAEKQFMILRRHL